MVYKLSDKKTGSDVSANEQLAAELHKPVTKKFKWNVYTRLKDNIWAEDLAKMESLSSKNKNVKLCVMEFFTTYVWVKNLKYKEM